MWCTVDQTGECVKFKDIWREKGNLSQHQQMHKSDDRYGMSDTGDLSENFMTYDESSDNKEEPIDIVGVIWFSTLSILLGYEKEKYVASVIWDSVQCTSWIWER